MRLVGSAAACWLWIGGCAATESWLDADALASQPTWLLLATLAIGTLVSEDLACIAAGLLVAAGRLGLVEASVACGVGILAGDVGLFLLGRWAGSAVLTRPWVRRRLSIGRLRRAERWLSRWGGAVIVASRFMPGSRFPTYVAAGALGTRLEVFLLWFVAAVAVWTPTLVGLTAWLGSEALERLQAAQAWLGWVVVAWVVAYVAVRWILGLALSHRKRRRALGAWRRWTRWEFWPAWIVYAPVGLWVLWLGIRFRGLTTFTAANPGIPAGGFVGESKAEILERLRSTEGLRVPGWRRIETAEPERRLEAFEAAVSELGLAYPVVLKPDEGQRGSGVAVVGVEDEARAYLGATTAPTLVQEHVPGVELGLFYERHPEEPRGRVVSVTEKHLPTVEGDGVRTLEELVLDDARAVAVADVYLERLGEGAARIPARGEVVALASLGTHCRGAVFLDGERWRTPELEAAVDTLARSFDGGFFFGRLDVKAPCFAVAARGDSMALIELNGVTSERTHIYDPRHGFVYGLRELCAQWRRAFEIGAAHRARGVQTTPVGELLGAWRRHRRIAVEHPPEAPPGTPGREQAAA